MKQPSAPVVEQIYPSLQDEGRNFRLFEICKLKGRLKSEKTFQLSCIKNIVMLLMLLMVLTQRWLY